MTKTKHIDARILRTRQLLQNALVELLEEKSLECITVSELTKHANVNRVTFYHHYRDIEHMIICIADKLVEDVANIFKSKNDQHCEIDWEVTQQFLEHIVYHLKLYQFLLVNPKIVPFREQLLYLISMHLEELQDQWQMTNMGFQKDVLLWRDAYAFMGIIEAWLNKGIPYTPKYLIQQLNLMYELNYVVGHRTS